MKEFSAGIPRRMYWSKDVGGKSHCPECGARLKNESHTYMMAVLEDSEVQPFVVGANYGYFCKRCPVVVLDHQGFAQLAGLGSGQDNVPFSVLGLVDLDAIPEEKSHIPLGEDNNPVPLVEFSNLEQEDVGGGNRAARRARRKSGDRRKRRR